MATENNNTVDKVVAYTVEHLKALGNYDVFEGYLAHMRAIPLGGTNDFKLVNKKLHIENMKNIKPVIRDSKIIKILNSILAKWFNRELTMKTNILSIDNVFEDLEDLLTIEDGLLISESKKIINKLQNILTSEVEIETDFNDDVIVFLEPFKVTYTDVNISIPPEMLTEPMDITRSMLYSVLDDIEFTIEKDKLNILIDGNNNAFIVDENMHKRIVMKLFTNSDLIINQVLGD